METQEKMSLIKIEDATMDSFIGALYNLYKADKILSDASLTRFSIDFKNQKTPTLDAEFSLCSDRFAT